ncbi:unnamed protein product [Darwinula stevensoni]|uniref:Mos1 transposase HTH domain-containing protein n=1 Tax=Darwinula stevensoni TaxID=69355 RepID=A0A7R9A8S8_9CRUS|nr:unnamed protein product [Darwinula stevensoni]CAG0896742.1 unnamed protein product [Darwinula stevensoni]
MEVSEHCPSGTQSLASRPSVSLRTSFESVSFLRVVTVVPCENHGVVHDGSHQQLSIQVPCSDSRAEPEAEVLCRRLFNRARGRSDHPEAYDDCGLCLPGYVAESWGVDRESEVCSKSSEGKEKKAEVPALAIAVGCVIFLVLLVFLVRRLRRRNRSRKLSETREPDPSPEDGRGACEHQPEGARLEGARLGLLADFGCPPPSPRQEKACLASNLTLEEMERNTCDHLLIHTFTSRRPEVSSLHCKGPPSPPSKLPHPSKSRTRNVLEAISSRTTTFDDDATSARSQILRGNATLFGFCTTAPRLVHAQRPPEIRASKQNCAKREVERLSSEGGASTARPPGTTLLIGGEERDVLREVSSLPLSFSGQITRNGMAVGSPLTFGDPLAFTAFKHSSYADILAENERADDESCSSSHRIPPQKMEEKRVHIRHCLLFDFDLGISATQAPRHLCQTEGRDAPSLNTCHYWYSRFRSGDRSLEDRPSGVLRTRSDLPLQPRDTLQWWLFLQLGLVAAGGGCIRAEEFCKTFNRKPGGIPCPSSHLECGSCLDGYSAEEWSGGRVADVCRSIRTAFELDQDDPHRLDPGDPDRLDSGDPDRLDPGETPTQPQGSSNLVNILVPIAVICFVLIAVGLWFRRRKKPLPLDAERNGESEEDPIFRGSLTSTSTVRFDKRTPAVFAFPRGRPQLSHRGNKTLPNGEVEGRGGGGGGEGGGGGGGEGGGGGGGGGGSVREMSLTHQEIISCEAERLLQATPNNWEHFKNNPCSAFHYAPGIETRNERMTPSPTPSTDSSSISTTSTTWSPPHPSTGSSPSWSQPEQPSTQSPSLPLCILPPSPLAPVTPLTQSPSARPSPTPPPSTPSHSPRPSRSASSSSSNRSPSPPPPGPPPEGGSGSGRQWKRTTSVEHVQEILSVFISGHLFRSLSSRNHHREEAGRDP